MVGQPWHTGDTLRVQGAVLTEAIDSRQSKERNAQGKLHGGRGHGADIYTKCLLAQAFCSFINGGTV